MKSKTKRAREKIRRRRRRTLLAISGALVLIAGWLVWSMLQGARDSGAAAASGSERQGIPQGEAGPDFSVPTIDGDLFRLSEQRGRPTILFIMAYWCGTCIPEAQALARLHAEYGEAVSILALDVDPGSTPEALAQFKDAVGNPDYTWAFDAGQKVARAYNIVSLDTTVIFDAQGRIVYRDRTPTPYENLKQVIEPLVESGARDPS